MDENIFPERSRDPRNLVRSHVAMGSESHGGLAAYFDDLTKEYMKGEKVHYFHGTIASIDGEIEPSKSVAMGDRKVVMATDVFSIAVLFIARWGSEDFELHSDVYPKDGKPFFVLRERRVGALKERLDVPGYVYWVPPDSFKPGGALLGGHGFVSDKPVKIARKHHIASVLKYLRGRKDLKMVAYGQKY
ncbi:MAG: hypothetical protein JSW58_06455 [Candidatus Latescibacterota bacterium]|nr:MAG: hypothetical protein JSW58_06455 [Candidatus Latescibacterota bacterium]